MNELRNDLKEYIKNFIKSDIDISYIESYLIAVVNKAYAMGKCDGNREIIEIYSPTKKITNKVG